METLLKLSTQPRFGVCASTTHRSISQRPVTWNTLRHNIGTPYLAAAPYAVVRMLLLFKLEWLPPDLAYFVVQLAVVIVREMRLPQMEDYEKCDNPLETQLPSENGAY
ncbi:hypothetical protein LMH87_005522 [Akanthomyces muscarius]|uniref:Uncharacterized protein n=1 Tax=Akanthomyces muscarius TaxID=2231603 RepID=A0A9W8QKW5_AKAMU|nr:hypothetical protein LMH87_005522 [Akanthomyces muscarius]KAJ4163818.1 hypothetical protein LMH87_005522 [Akanthomyces muscarius]